MIIIIIITVNISNEVKYYGILLINNTCFVYNNDNNTTMNANNKCTRGAPSRWGGAGAFAAVDIQKGELVEKGLARGLPARWSSGLFRIITGNASLHRWRNTRNRPELDSRYQYVFVNAVSGSGDGRNHRLLVNDTPPFRSSAQLFLACDTLR